MLDEIDTVIEMAKAAQGLLSVVINRAEKLRDATMDVSGEEFALINENKTDGML